MKLKTDGHLVISEDVEFSSGTDIDTGVVKFSCGLNTGDDGFVIRDEQNSTNVLEIPENSNNIILADGIQPITDSVGNLGTGTKRFNKLWGRDVDVTEKVSCNHLHLVQPGSHIHFGDGTQQSTASLPSSYQTVGSAVGDGTMIFDVEGIADDASFYDIDVVLNSTGLTNFSSTIGILNAVGNLTNMVAVGTLDGVVQSQQVSTSIDLSWGMVTFSASNPVLLKCTYFQDTAGRGRMNLKYSWTDSSGGGAYHWSEMSIEINSSPIQPMAQLRFRTSNTSAVFSSRTKAIVEKKI